MLESQKPRIFCFSCGARKSNYDHTCDACGKTPESETELAISMLLCEIFNWPGHGLDYDEVRIEEIAGEIANGVTFEFPESDIAHAKKIVRASKSRLDLAYHIIYAIVFFGAVVASLVFLGYKLYGWLAG